MLHPHVTKQETATLLDLFLTWANQARDFSVRFQWILSHRAEALQTQNVFCPIKYIETERNMKTVEEG